MRKINLIFGDEIDETIGSEGFTVSELSIQLKKSSKKERFGKMKENLVDAIWKQSKCFGLRYLNPPPFDHPNFFARKIQQRQTSDVAYIRRFSGR